MKTKQENHSTIFSLIDKLELQHSLTLEEYELLVRGCCEEGQHYIRTKAQNIRKKIYGTDVYIRGLIEFTNLCKNNCFYCGIRRSNLHCERYRLTPDEILECCSLGYELGFRTFVLQGGEDSFWNDSVLCSMIETIKHRWPDCAVTLSVGERSRDSYQQLFDSGADRYLLRHETADQEHYEKLHPSEMSFKNRMRCLYDLKEIGYQVGCGFMVGSPYQTPKTLAKDLKFIETFGPDMCGIGPFLPHKDTPFGTQPAGTLEETLWLLSILRLMRPNLLLPATTALGTLQQSSTDSSSGTAKLGSRELGILAGANVVMPNLSPISVRKKYELYDHKICTGEEAAECKNCLSAHIHSIGYEIVTHRGDPIKAPF